MILKNDGTVWGAGGNSSGQLGVGGTSDRLSFAQSIITDVIQINAGNSHSRYVKSNGKIFGSGYNLYSNAATGTANILTPAEKIIP